MSPVKALIIFVSIFLWSAGPAAHRAVAGFDADNVDVLTPTSAWLVGPATLSPMQAGGFSMPCIMMNQYNNGFVVRISGGGDRVMAMAVDFRQDVFRAGDTMDLKLSIADFNTVVPSTALNNTTLLLDMQNAGGIYKALTQGKYMDLSFSGKPFTFALLGVSDGLKRVEQCYDPKQGQSPARQAQPVAGFSNMVPGMQDSVPPTYRAQNLPATPEASGDDSALVPIPGGDRPQAPASSAQGPAGLPGPSSSAADIVRPQTAQAPQQADGTAKKPVLGQDFAGKLDSLDQMIENVAQRLDNIAPAAGQVPAAIQPDIGIQVQPGQNAQVPYGAQQNQQGRIPAQPIGRPLANSWSAPLVPRAKGLKQEDVMPASLPGESQGYLPQVRRWRAISGSNLREVLDVWAGSENARLVWQSDREYAIQKSFSLEGTFEQVVANILGQYSDQHVRPTGRIYYDPDANQKVLLIESY